MNDSPRKQTDAHRWVEIQKTAEETIRLGRARTVFQKAIWLLALPCLGIVGFSLTGILASEILWLFFYFALSSAVGAPVLAYLWPVSDRQIWNFLDRHSPLPDLAVSAAEFLRETPSLLAKETIRRAIHHFSAQPLRNHPNSPAISLATKACALSLLLALALFPFIAIDPALPELSAEEQQHRQNVEELANYYSLWQDMSADFDSEDWENLEIFLQNLSEDLDPEQTDVRELFRQIQQIEERLANLTAQLTSSNLQEVAATLAREFRDRSGWEEVANAFAQDDFSASAEALQEQSHQLRQAEAEREADFPLSDEDASIFDLAADLSEQAGEQEWADLFREASESIRNEDIDGFCDAIEKMAALCEAEEEKRQQQEAARSMASQLEENQQALAEQRQMAQAQDPRQQGEDLLAQLSSGDQEGDGIGQGSDDSLGWGDRSFDTEYFTEHLQGMISSEGESEERTIAGQESSSSSRQGHRNIDPSEFSELSREAIENENIPLAHRESVRRYFEGIRPSSSND
ncbi:MAG: hypothetical protein LAT55_00190 [Opitutales bacterium]|nr:hypothetical protein [Opitutales bacterium]